MGQRQTSQMQEYLSPILTQILSEEPVNTLLSDEIHSLTYEQFLGLLGEINLLSKECLDPNGQCLVFAVKKGTDSTLFWKGTVQIAAVKYNKTTKKVESYRLLDLSEFLKVFKTLKCQNSAIEQSKNTHSLTVSTLLANLDEAGGTDTLKECCICLERKQEVILPCAHSFCSKCIEDWNAIHNTCPICREKLESTEDTWVLSEVPQAEEISQEIKRNLMKLSERSGSDCSSNGYF